MQELDYVLFMFRSGTHGLNKELGRHRGREGKLECALCGAECENVVHVLCRVFMQPIEIYESSLWRNFISF